MLPKKRNLFLAAVLAAQPFGVYATNQMGYFNVKNSAITVTAMAFVSAVVVAYKYFILPVSKQEVKKEADKVISLVEIVEPAQEAPIEPRVETTVIIPFEESVVIQEVQEAKERLLVTTQLMPLYDQSPGSYNVYLK